MVGRPRSLAWLWLLVAIQVAIPASYYLRGGSDADERFAWRMFSSVRLQHCRVRAERWTASGEASEIQLATSLHSSWVNALKRGRKRVIERFLATRCEGGVRGAALERSCEGVRSGRGTVERYRYDCQTRRFFEASP